MKPITHLILCVAAVALIIVSVVSITVQLATPEEKSISSLTSGSAGGSATFNGSYTYEYTDIIISASNDIAISLTKTMYFKSNVSPAIIDQIYVPDGMTVELTYTSTSMTFGSVVTITISGAPTVAGSYETAIKVNGGVDFAEYPVTVFKFHITVQ